MKKIDLMIFDLDGTIASTGHDLVDSINYTLHELGLENKSEHEIIGYVGDGISKLIERVLGPGSIRLHQDAMSIFTDYYGKHLLDKTVLYPHVEDVLRHFGNKTKIVLTNKRYRFTEKIVKGLKIEHYFTEIIGIDSLPYFKPDRRVVEYLLSKYVHSRKTSLMIGDGVNDVMTARNSGILSCACLNGLGKRDDLLKLDANYYCEDILEMTSLFK